MLELNDSFRNMLIKVICRIIAGCEPAMIQEFSFPALSKHISDGQKILETMARSKIQTLYELDLTDNSTWWVESDNLEILQDFLVRLIELTILKIGEGNDFNKDQCLTLLQSIMNAPFFVKHSLATLDLSNFNFDLDQSCEALANIIASSKSLTKLSIEN